ncbi:hypothetical protein [Rothia aerolata]|uniref:Uncharacterized protein n=1 Tax=Rothia aerolata TaxID=1812262 RepID=A0A917MTF9_9MICC|nr:hypothetical protein [Rothia aerolata]GGH63308.1 hypothetical protein GCM10007359_14450 [Rothia aerolata]
MTQQNSPGNTSKTAVVLTIASWIIFGILMFLRSDDLFKSSIWTLAVAIFNVGLFLDLRKGFSLVRWSPLRTFLAVIASHLFSWIIFPESPAQVVFTFMIALFASRLSMDPKDSKKSRTAKDLGV